MAHGKNRREPPGTLCTEQAGRGEEDCRFPYGAARKSLWDQGKALGYRTSHSETVMLVNAMEQNIASARVEEPCGEMLSTGKAEEASWSHPE